MSDIKDLYEDPVKVKILDPKATIPTRAHQTDAGFDIHALEDTHIQAGETKKVRTGIALGIPPGYSGDVRSRSGLAARNIVVANSPGTIDPGYTGEVLVLLRNQSATNFDIEAGDRIAQLVVTYINTQTLEVVDDLGTSERGDGGFGSTGL